VNKLIELQVVHKPSESVSYLSRVEEIDARGIWIANPTHQGSLVLIPVGEEITVFYGDEICIYKFPSVVLSRQKTPLPMLLLAHPEPQKVMRIQRRDYVRIPAKVPVEYMIVSAEQDVTKQKKFKTTSVDISGGGLNLVTNVPLNKQDLLQLTITLDGEPIVLNGIVIRTSSQVKLNNLKQTTAGVQFINIQENDREKIIKFVFQWQLNKRRKGLL
jgi:c-di-GMP-binding flagellar brake protein YcgR